MKTYWDSSSLIKALHSLSALARSQRHEQCTRVHSVAEVFSTLTGGRLGMKYLPNDAAKMVADLTQNFEFVELSEQDTKEALKKCQKHGVSGGRVHDWLHAVAAKKAGAKELLTQNLSDFQGLQDGFSISSA